MIDLNDYGPMATIYFLLEEPKSSYLLTILSANNHVEQKSQ